MDGNIINNNEEKEKIFLNNNVESIKKYFDKAYSLALERSLSNLIRNFGFTESNFFPKTEKKKFDYYDMMFAIPKAYSNRYAKLWISLFPSRVNYLNEIIKANLDIVLEYIRKIMKTNLNTILEHVYTTNQELFQDFVFVFQNLTLNQNEINDAFLLSKFFKGLHNVISFFNEIKSDDKRAKEAMEKLLKALGELKENYLYGPIDKVFIQTIALNFPERSSIFVSANETIPYIQFWGSNVFSVRINGILPNAINIDGKNIMIKEWFSKIRGTQLAKNYCALFLDFEDNILTLYPVDFSFAQNVNEVGAIGFSMGGYLTRIMYSPINSAITDELKNISRGSNNDKYKYFIKPRIKEIEIIEV